MTSDKRSVQYTYDAFGRLASSTEGTGRTETFVRDALGRATNETQTVWDEMSWTNRVASIDRPLDAFACNARGEVANATISAVSATWRDVARGPRARRRRSCRRRGCRA